MDFLDITLGNVITWVGIAVGIGMSLQKLKSLGEASAERAETNAAKIDELAKDVKHLDENGGTATRGRHDALSKRVDQLERVAQQDADQRSKIAVVANDIKWIKSVLKSVLRHNKQLTIEEDETED